VDTIVVGIDGSKGAQAAATWAATHAASTGGRVLAVFGVPRTELWSMSAVQVNIDNVLADYQELLDDKWCAGLRKSGVAFSTQIVRGDPATALLSAAKRVNATMIVLGTKGHTALADLVVGGTVHKVINRANLPVVLIPHAKPVKKAAKKG
jgi:nucleotide-binding universal stress UspA family protein